MDNCKANKCIVYAGAAAQRRNNFTAQDFQLLRAGPHPALAPTR